MYKVVQDFDGEWGILNLAAPSMHQAFASWGRLHGQHEEIIGFAIDLNSGAASAGEFYWTQYEPRMED